MKRHTNNSHSRCLPLCNSCISAGKSHFDAQNDPNARFIIQTDGAFTMAAGAKIILANGAKAQTFWLINGAASLAANAEAKGVLYVLSYKFRRKL
jgi:hypothetical protein